MTRWDATIGSLTLLNSAIVGVMVVASALQHYPFAPPLFFLAVWCGNLAAGTLLIGSVKEVKNARTVQ